jgi:hypothetical protein
MVSVSESAVLGRSPEVVFHAAADPECQLVWDAATLRSVEKLSTGALGPGARYRGDFKGFGKVEYEFAEYEPGRRFAHVARIKMGEMRHVFTFEEVPQGTRMTQEGRLEPNAIGRLLGPVMMRSLKKRFRTIAVELNDYLATDAAEIVSPPRNGSTAGAEAPAE